MKTMKEHVRSDGNGAFIISKPAMALISLFLIILGMIVPMVMGYGGLSERVNNLEELETEYSKIMDDINLVDKKVAVIEERLNSIDSNINEIKELLKNRR